MAKRCEQCDMIPLVRIHNPNEYIMCIDSFQRMIDKGEDFIKSLGISQVRGRVHGGNLARIEVSPTDFGQLLDNREAIHSKLKDIGFAYITMDMIGYRTGSMNEVLSHADKGNT